MVETRRDRQRKKQEKEWTAAGARLEAERVGRHRSALARIKKATESEAVNIIYDQLVANTNDMHETYNLRDDGSLDDSVCEKLQDAIDTRGNELIGLKTSMFKANPGLASVPIPAVPPFTYDPDGDGPSTDIPEDQARFWEQVCTIARAYQDTLQQEQDKTIEPDIAHTRKEELIEEFTQLITERTRVTGKVYGVDDVEVSDVLRTAPVEMLKVWTDLALYEKTDDEVMRALGKDMMQKGAAEKFEERTKIFWKYMGSYRNQSPPAHIVVEGNEKVGPNGVKADLTPEPLRPSKRKDKDDKPEEVTADRALQDHTPLGAPASETAPDFLSMPIDDSRLDEAVEKIMSQKLPHEIQHLRERMARQDKIIRHLNKKNKALEAKTAALENQQYFNESQKKLEAPTVPDSAPPTPHAMENALRSAVAYAVGVVTKETAILVTDSCRTTYQSCADHIEDRAAEQAEELSKVKETVDTMQTDHSRKMPVLEQVLKLFGEMKIQMHELKMQMGYLELRVAGLEIDSDDEDEDNDSVRSHAVEKRVVEEEYGDGELD